jgi:hypothetical protein
MLHTGGHFECFGIMFFALPIQLPYGFTHFINNHVAGLTDL